MELSEHTVCIGVGSDVSKIDDVSPFVHLWKASAIAGMKWHERVVYVFWAHDLVRPRMIMAVANSLLLEQQPATVEYIKGLLPRLFKRNAIAKRPAGQDRLHLGSSFTRAHMFAGTAILNKKLECWHRVEKLAGEIVHLIGNGCTYSELTDKIAEAGLPGQQSATGYWTNHLARILTPGFTTSDLPGSVDIDPVGMKRLLGMGEGACDGLAVLGIDAANSTEALPRLCRTVEWLSRRVGREVKCTVPQIVVACCESHRRGALRICPVTIGRRTGL